MKALPGLLLIAALTSLGAVDKPNILWITAEDMSANLGCYGDRFARTPNLDAFAKQSVRYTRAFATAPVCAPARACLVTGVYATSLGNPHLRCQITLPEGFRGHAAYLRDAGYFTANNVKTDYNLRDEEAFKQAAWDRCDAQAHWRQRRPGQPFFAIFNLMETHQSRTGVWPWEQYEEFISQRLRPAERANPARVRLPPFYPDTPLARRAMARYYDCIQAMDKEAGRILSELEADGLADDTIVFFYSDHGMGMPRGKRLLHDSGLHVPLLVRFPKKFQHLAPARPGRTVDRLVSFVDFAPTLLSLAGLPVPAHMQGVAFLGPAGGKPREFVFGARDRVDEVYDTARSVRDARWLYIRNYAPHLPWAQPEGFSDQSDFRRELVRLGAEGKLNAAQRAYTDAPRPVEELYDTRADPHQVRNLAGERKHAAVLDRMRDALREWLLESRDLGFIPEQQLAHQAGATPPWNWARYPDHYDIENILAAAERVGQPDALARQIAALHSTDEVVRYWAVVGLRAAGAEAAAERETLVESLEDVSAAVRIEAAGVLTALDDEESPRALQTLTAALAGDDLHAALHAARTLQLLGRRALPVLPALKSAREAARGLADADMALYLGFALDAAIAALER